MLMFIAHARDVARNDRVRPDEYVIDVPLALCRATRAGVTVEVHETPTETQGLPSGRKHRPPRHPHRICEAQDPRCN